MKKFIESLKTALAASVLLILIAGVPAYATEIFGEDTGKECTYCHLGQPDKLEFTVEGEAFVKNYYRWPLPVPFMESFKKKFSVKAHRLILALHAIAAYLLIGILAFRGFVSAPDLESGGIPTRERKLSFTSFLLIALSGVALLPFLGIDKKFLSSQFAYYLDAKIILFICMAFLSGYLGKILSGRLGDLRRRMLEEEGSGNFGHYEKFSPDDLKKYSGSGGKRALIAFKGKVFDVTDAPNWPKGMHLNRHRAGRDLTEEIKMAPHKNTVMQKIKVVGDYGADARESGSPLVREFNRLASRYHWLTRLNLSVAAAIVLILAFWRQ